MSNQTTIPDLYDLTLEERGKLAIQLIEEQILQQRIKLHFWRDITGQPAQIDTGYIAQHLVSLATGIKGGGFRGKGDDLEDGSEVKSANFLDSEDAKGSKAPRWNFPCTNELQMLKLLDYPSIYLVSIDVNADQQPRFRVWKLFPRKHQTFFERYNEWMTKLGYPKLSNPKAKANYQLFPPKNKTDDDYARHGNGRVNGFPKIQIQLNDNVGSRLIFHAEVHKDMVKLIKLREWTAN